MKRTRHRWWSRGACAAALILFAASPALAAGSGEYSTLVVADHGPARAGIRITYLGVNGYQFETGGSALVVDPYFTRAGFWTIATNQTLTPNESRIADGRSHLRPKVDAILVTHAHFDHLLDVPRLLRLTNARLMAGPTAVHLAEALGTPAAQCSIVAAGQTKTIGPWKIRVLAAEHDRVFGSTPPYPGTASGLTKPPARASDWKLGEPLAFVIEGNGRRIYLDSGGIPETRLPRLGKIDLAIVGVALPDSRRRLAEIVRALRPRYILPSHQDDFFAPAAGGFSFGKLTNFPEVLRIDQSEHLPGRLILLDYFRPWTLD